MQTRMLYVTKNLLLCPSRAEPSIALVEVEDDGLVLGTNSEPSYIQSAILTPHYERFCVCDAAGRTGDCLVD